MAARQRGQRRPATPATGSRGPTGPAKRRLPWLPLSVAAAVVILLVVAATTIVQPTDRAFRVWRAGGTATALSPGVHFAWPLLQQIVRVPKGPIEVEGSIPIQTREGAELTAGYRLSASISDARLVDLWTDARPSAGRPDVLLTHAADESLQAWAREATSDGLVLGEGRAALERSVREKLEGLGFEQVSVALLPVGGAAGLQGSLALSALRQRISPTGVRLAIIGLDGADWENIDPLIAKGQLPNLARLKAKGAWGNMKSMNPMLSPLLWTTVATGKPPEQHGILDFLVRDSATGKPVPVTSRGRKVSALWNMLSHADRTSAFVAWWATWPAEEVDGYMVSDRVAYSLFSFVEGRASDRAGATWPPGYFQEIRPKLVDAAQIKDEELRFLGDATPEEFRRMATIVASARSYHAIALDILARGQPDLFSVYYQGIDEICHRYAHFMPPRMAMATPEEFRRYQGTVAAYYRYQDRLLGEVLAHLAPDTNFVVLSDHGFRNGGGRPADDPPYVEGKPGLWHRRYGILIMAGPSVRPGRLDTTELLDVAPTALYLLGLPRAEDMPGRILVEAIDPGFLARFPSKTLPSYEVLEPPRRPGEAVVADGGVDEEIIDKLRSLGYVGGAEEGGEAPAGEALVTARLNEATLHLKNKDYAKAEASVAAALNASPELLTAFILKAQIAAEQKRYPEAIATCKRIIEIDPLGERQAYTQLGRIFADSGRTEEGVAFLRGLVRAHPEVAETHAALGALLLRAGDRAAAEKELLEALRVNPASGEPLAELHTLYRGTDKIPTLEGIVRKGLEMNDQSVVHHNWMGLIYEWRKDLPKAEQEFRRAMELDPDYAATMANLGALLGRSGRLPEAVAILTRAVAKDADNIEAWINLGAAQGRLNNPKEAIAALETARSKGARSTTLYNALALAYLQDRQKEKAVGYLKESLLIDPQQKDARDLLAAVNRSS